MTQDSAKPIKTAESDRPYPIGIDPAAYEGDIVSRLRHWRGLHLAHNGELFEAAADEIELLKSKLRLQDAVIRSGDTLMLTCGEKAAIQFMLRHAAHAADEPAFHDSADYRLHSEALYGLLDRTAKWGTTQPRNGAVVGPDTDSRVWETPVHTPPTHTTPGEGSTPREGT